MGSQKRSALSRYQAGGRAWWETAISDVAPGSIVLRGHRVEDLIGSMSYAGIVGLLVKKRMLLPSLGRLAAPMFECMGERGPDSGGMAVFGEPTVSSQRRFKASLI